MEPSSTPRVQHFPVTLFASVMGLGGLSLAWRRAALAWEVSPLPGQVLYWLALTAFVVVLTTYVVKWVVARPAAVAELRHPIRLAFVPTTTIAVLVLATAGQDLLPAFSEVLWWIGAVGHLVLTVAVLSAWFAKADLTLTQVTPAWFIPVVGNVVTPLAARELGSVDLAWFAFGVGVLFWLALLPVLMLRLLVHSDPLPPRLLPTLSIFVAPPAVSLLSWMALTGDTSGPGVRVLHGATVMFVVLVLVQAPRLVRLPFGMPWWAHTFPLAAATAATVAVAAVLPGTAYDVVAVAMLVLSTTVVTVVAALTLRAAARREICVPD